MAGRQEMARFWVWTVMMMFAQLAPWPVRADLAAAMEQVRSEDWSAARRAADGAIETAIVDWHILRAGDGSFDAYAQFASRYPHWPGMALLHRRGEDAIPAGASPAAVIAYFNGRTPATGEGALRLADALRQSGDPAAAAAVAVAAWRTLSLAADTESTLLAAYGQALGPHHTARLDDLLWRDRLAEAERMRSRVPAGHRALLDARAALSRDAPGVDGLIAAVPDDLANDPGLAFARMEWRARKGRTDSVVDLMLERSATAERLGRPEHWASRRRTLARQMMRAGRAREAYLLASQHHLTEGSAFADLEWLSGYIALRKLNNPAAALDHFQRFRAGVRSPISLGRAGYWEGRAREAMGDTAGAAAAYARGAEYQTSFYGQLAAERAGLPADPLMSGTEPFPGASDASFRRSTVYQAALALHRAGERVLAARFFSHLAESLTRTEIGQLATLLGQLGDPYLQLRVAKRAASAGHMLHAAYFPVVRIPTDRTPLVSPELALAIARRESEFNPTVVSPAGARGLMQVMPGTAEDTARALGLSYSRGRLTSDPAYNATLGTAYLQKLRAEFGAATILVAAAYNAGPGRPRRWVTEFGDPRDASVDAVDWIEHIPFRETRNYVMRVTESLMPYRARLSGQVPPLTLAQDIEAR